MKYLIVASLFFSLFSCASKNNDKLILKGKLSNFEEQSFVLCYEDKIDTLYLSETGYFEKELELDHNLRMVLRSKNFSGQLFLMPGYDIEFSLDNANLESGFKFLNENLSVTVSQYLFDKFVLADQLKENRKAYFSLLEDEFIRKTKQVNSQKTALIHKLKKENVGLDTVFVKEELAMLKYEMLNQFLDYESSHRYYAKDFEFEASESIIRLLQEEDLNAGELLRVQSYKTYLRNRISAKGFQLCDQDSLLSENPEAQHLSQFHVMDKVITNQKVRDFLAYEITYERIGWGIKGAKDILKKFENTCTNQAFVSKVNAYVKKWHKLEAGNAAINFEGLSVDDKTISLSDFKGQYVYVDVWATWCGPCCAEIPYLQKLEKDYHGKNIVFLSVSVDDDINRWKKMIKKKQMGGVQINVGHRTTINRDYIINGIPRFMLFDPKGNIVDVNAPRPSGNIRELFKSLNDL